MPQIKALEHIIPCQSIDFIVVNFSNQALFAFRLLGIVSCLDIVINSATYSNKLPSAVLAIKQRLFSDVIHKTQARKPASFTMP